jgi:hypothetical protein
MIGGWFSPVPIPAPLLRRYDDPSMIIDPYKGLAPISRRNYTAPTFTRAGTSWRSYYSGTGMLAEAIANNIHRNVHFKDVNGNEIYGVWLHASCTNKVLRSCDLNTAPWTLRGTATVSEDTAETTDPAGGNNASLVTGIGASLDDMYQSISGYSGASKKLATSLWIKPKVADGTLTIGNPSGGLGFGSWQVDLSAIDAGWTRVSRRNGLSAVSAEFVSNGASAGGIYLVRNAGSNPLEFYVWCAGQEENGYYEASPTIGPTAGSSVSSVADSVIAYTAKENIGGEDVGQGTLVFDYLRPCAEVPLAQKDVVKISDGGAAADQILFNLDASGYPNVATAATGGDAGAVQIAHDVCTNEIHRFVVRWKANQLDLAMQDKNSGTITEATSDTDCDMPDDVDQLDLCVSDGIIGNIQCYPRYVDDFRRFME